MDGIPDIAVVTGQSPSSRGGSISIIKGVSNGLFYSPRSFPSGRDRSASGKGTTTGDFDNDGKIDIVSLTNRIDFLKGVGDGTFLQGQLAFSGLNSGYSLTGADFDKDGNLDLAWGQSTIWNKPLTLFVIYGNGTFTSGNTIQWGSNGQTVENVLVSDFNNDTYPDIAVFSHTSDSAPYIIIANLDVFLYNPSNPRNFIHSDSSPNLNIGTTRGSAFSAGDVDNDGKIDLVGFGVGPNRILFFKGIGDGTFNPSINAGSTGAEPFFDSILKDINSDGKLDLIIGTYNDLYVHIGNGDGSFGTHTTYPNGTSISQIALDDLDGDGNQDIATAHGSTTESDGFSVLKGLGNGTFSNFQRFSVGHRFAYSLNIADLNLDGKPDIVVEHNGSDYNYFTVLINDSGPRANLSITKTLVSSNENIFTYTIGVTNPGPDIANNVRIVDPIRSNAIFLSANPSQGSCQISSSNLVCNLLNILPLSSVSITLQIQAMDLGSIENTASVLSETEDPNTSNNAALSTSIQDIKFLKIYAAKNVEVGTEETYSILYYNQLSTPLNDVVVVFDIPRTSIYLASSNNGIYRGDLNQVFWKLGTVPGKGSGILFVKVSIPWGIPPHTDQTLLAMFGAQGQADNPFELEDYLIYTGRQATQISNLTPPEIDNLLENDPTLNLYHSYCENYGFRFYNKATKVLFDDGSSFYQLWEINPDTSQISSPTKTNTGQFIESVSKSFISYMNTEMGIRYNAQNSSFSTFITGGGPPPSLRNQQPTWTRCFVNCLVENIPLWILGEKVKLMGIIFDLMDCNKCIRTKEETSCIKCAASIADKVGKEVPLVGEILDIGQCKFDCDTDPSSHVCVAGTSKLKCEKCSNFDKFFGCENVIQRKFNCVWGGVYELVPETIFCAWCGYREVQVCKGDNCACIPCDSTKVDCKNEEILVAHDPNYKEGMGSFVSQGQRLDFKIHYENEGSGTAYGVYIIDKLDDKLDDSTLSIQNGGEYYQSIRTIFWQIGNLNPGQGGTVEFSVNIKSDAPLGEWVKNQAVVVFPSSSETTYTNLLSAEIKNITAYSQNLLTNEGEALPITLEGFDPLGLVLNFSIFQNPINGEITGTPPDIIYTPYENFEGQDEFKFTVDNGVQTSEPGTVRINVLSNPSDNIPPEVVSTIPLNGSSVFAYQDAYLPGYYLPAIKGCFNEPLDPATVNSSNVILTDGIINFSGNIYLDNTDNCINFLLSEPLSYGTQYTVNFLSGIKDTSGNNLSQNYSWTFFTYPNTQLNSNPNILDFGNVEANQYSDKILEIHNTGTSDLLVSSVYITGTNQNKFSIQNDGCSSETLTSGSFCVLNMRFSPDFNGYYEAYLTVSSSAGNLNIQMFGNGTGGNCLNLLGDVNTNNNITAYDASLTLQAVVGLITLTPLQKCAADTNENSQITSLDAAFTLQCAVGLCSALPSNFKTSCISHGNCP